MNVSKRYWSPIHANECVFSLNEEQKVYDAAKSVISPSRLTLFLRIPLLYPFNTTYIHAFIETPFTGRFSQNGLTIYN